MKKLVSMLVCVVLLVAMAFVIAPETKAATVQETGMAIAANAKAQDGTFPASLPEGQTYHSAYCYACGKEAQWKPLTQKPSVSTAFADGDHYYLPGNVSIGGQLFQWNAKKTLCIHTNGKTLTDPSYRIVLVNSGGTLNIMGGGAIEANTKNNRGILYSNGACSINVYGTTLKNTATENNPEYGNAVLCSYGQDAVMNCWGAKLIGNDLSPVILANGAVNLYNCTVTGVPAQVGNYCDRTDDKAVLNLHDTTISGVNVLDGIGVTATGATKIGSLNMAEGTSFSASDLTADASIAGYPTKAMLVDAAGKTVFAQDVSAEWATGKYQYIRLFGDAALTLDGQEIVVDLCGNDLQVTGNGAVKAFDSANDTYDESACGVLLAGSGITVEKSFQAPNGNTYIAATENGLTKLHRLEIDLNTVTLRTSAAGLYYKATYNCDRTLAKLVKSYGVVLSLYNLPGADFMTEEAKGNYNAWTEATTPFQSGVVATSGSVFGILKDSRTAARNNEMGRMKIYANAYIDLDGEIIVANTADAGKTADAEGFGGTALSLYDVMQLLDASYSKQNTTTRLQLDAFYAQWKEAGMNDWGMTKIGTTTGITGKIDNSDIDVKFAPGTTDALCPACNKVVTWTAFVPSDKSQGLTGHYYLTDDVTFTGTDAAGIFYSKTAYTTLCFHLNGHNLTATKTRAIFGSSGALNVMGNGIVTGFNTAAAGAAVQTNNGYSGNTVRLYGGTYKRYTGTNAKAAAIGTYTVGGEILVYEGATIEAAGAMAVLQNKPTNARNSYVGLFGCTVTGDVVNEGSGSYKSSLEIIGATVNGTVQLKESNLYVAGAAKISGIDMDGDTRLQVGNLEDGASIGILNTGIFMDKGENNAAYLKYFKGASAADTISLKDGALYCGRDYLSDLQFKEGTTEALCPVCGTVKTWTPIDGSAPIVNGKVSSHYYLTQDVEFTAQNGELSFLDPTHGTHTVCFHLNGHNFTSTNSRFIYGSTCTTNIMGTGTVSGNRNDKYPYGATVQINVSNPTGTVNLYGGTWTQGEGGAYSAEDYVLSVSDNGSNICVYEDAKVVANSNGKAAYLGRSSMCAATLTLKGTIIGDVYAPGTTKGHTATLTLDGCTIEGTVDVDTNVQLVIAHDPKIQLLDLEETVQATLDNLTPGAKIVVKNEGIFTKANANAAQYAKYFEAQSRGDQIIVQDNQLRCKTDYEAKLYVDETGIAYCPVCKKNVQWTAVSSSEEGIVAVNGGHYYLVADIVYEKPYDGDTNTAFFNGVPTRNSSTCLHLNGHNLTATKTHGIFTGWGLTNIMGEGVVSGYASGVSTSSAVQINNSSPGSGVHLYSGTYRSQADSKSQYVVGISGVGGGLYIYEDADITSTTGKAIQVGQSGYRDSNLEIYGATIVGDIDTTVPKAMREDIVANAKLVLKNTTVNGKLELKSGNDLTLEGLTQITKLQIAAGEIVNFVDLKPGSSMAVAATGIFSGVLEQADAWLEYITCATDGDWINVRDKQFCQSIKSTIPVASADDEAALLKTYEGMQLRYGEMHNHSNSGPYRDDGTGISVSTGADGKNSLEEWIAEMDKLKMDFAFIVDHGQSIHMYTENFPNWREDYFIGGTEPGTTITDSKASQAKPHYNMLFADAASLESIFFKYENKYKPIQWTAENYPTAQNPYDYGYRVKYPTWTTAEFAQLAKDVYAAGGLLVQVHPKYDSYIYSDDPMDYYFADYTGFEITTGSGGDMMAKNNNEAYDTWVDLLEMGKIIYATAGSDRHRLPDYSGLAAIYTKRDHRDDYMSAVRVGNMAAGWVGIRMNVNGTPMGGETSFAGQRLQFSVGDIYNPGVTDYCGTENPYMEGHIYRVELYDDGGLLMAANIDPLQMNYFAIDCDEDAMFYRVVVWDVTDNERIGVSNPIWNR